MFHGIPFLDSKLMPQTKGVCTVRGIYGPKISSIFKQSVLLKGLSFYSQ